MIVPLLAIKRCTVCFSVQSKFVDLKSPQYLYLKIDVTAIKNIQYRYGDEPMCRSPLPDRLGRLTLINFNYLPTIKYGI